MGADDLVEIGSMPVGKPHNIAIHPNGRVAYVGSQVPGKFSLAVIDLSTRTIIEKWSWKKLRGAWNSTGREDCYTSPKREPTRWS